MSEPTPTPLSKEERYRAKRNRGLRAAPPSPASPSANGNAPNGEIASILDQIEEDNKGAGLAKAAPPAAVAAAAPPKTVKRIEIEHDYEIHGPGTFTTLRGVVLKVKPFSNELVIKTQTRMLPDRPKPPETWNEADQKKLIDDRDPEYREKLGAYLEQAADISYDLRVAYGTVLHPDYALPDGTVPPESDVWIDEITNPQIVGPYGIEVRREMPGRYLDWLKYYVCGEGDIRHLYEALDHASGIVREVAVIEAVKSFRGTD